MNRKQDEYRSAKIAIHQLDELVKVGCQDARWKILKMLLFVELIQLYFEFVL